MTRWGISLKNSSVEFAEASMRRLVKHLHPAEVIEPMVTLFLLADERDLTTPGVVRDLLMDPTAGTGGMLSVADDKVSVHQPTAPR